MQPDAIVVFTDQRQVPWLRGLQPGFRHCFVAVADDAGEWVACDWLMGRLVFQVYGPQDPETLIAGFVGRGHRVSALRRCRRRRRRGWLRPMSCVEVVKQAIGWGGVLPLTPFGLWRSLRAAGHRCIEP
ncbi:MAG: hypothetical protein EA356_06445 [Geminicoccaceae bacterium]|nr:MAG: hypothetical protein EA356_06445 [Geminicoccaceae bacterium]